MYDIIVIGSATRDAFFEGIPFAGVKNSKLFKTGSGICLSSGSKVSVPKITFTTGGAGTNAAATFARQEYKTAAIVRVGRDVSGEEVKRGLKKEKVDCSMFQIDKQYNTAYSVIFLEKSGERTILTFKGCGKNLSEKEIPWAKIKKTKWIYVDSLQGNEKLLRQIIDFAAKNNAFSSENINGHCERPRACRGGAWQFRKIPRFARNDNRGRICLATNPGSGELKIFKKNPKLLSAFDVFVLNQEEASFLTGIPYQNEKEIFKKLDKLVDGIVCMTKGPKGSAVSDGKFLWQAGCYKEKRMVDRTGAGDAFASGFVAGLMKYLNISKFKYLKEDAIERAVKLGSANATSVVEYIGAKEGILTPAKFRARKWGQIDIRKFKI